MRALDLKLIAGVRPDAAAIIYGDDFVMERTAQQVAAVLNSVDGAARVRRP